MKDPVSREALFCKVLVDDVLYWDDMMAFFCEPLKHIRNVGCELKGQQLLRTFLFFFFFVRTFDLPGAKAIEFQTKEPQKCLSPYSSEGLPLAFTRLKQK